LALRKNALPSRRTRRPLEIRPAAVGSFPESGPWDRSLSRVLELDPRFRAADQLGNIQLGNITACRMITFTFRDRSIALKETFNATFDPPDATITLG
jgi:hypothetical protein